MYQTDRNCYFSGETIPRSWHLELQKNFHQIANLMEILEIPLYNHSNHFLDQFLSCHVVSKSQHNFSDRRLIRRYILVWFPSPKYNFHQIHQFDGSFLKVLVSNEEIDLRKLCVFLNWFIEFPAGSRSNYSTQNMKTACINFFCKDKQSKTWKYGTIDSESSALRPPNTP